MFKSSTAWVIARSSFGSFLFDPKSGLLLGTKSANASGIDLRLSDHEILRKVPCSKEVQQKVDHQRMVERSARNQVLEAAHGPQVFFNVTNACNLKCAYCYADEGNYGGSAGGPMSYETMVSAWKALTKECEAVGGITFFGGEPTLNWKVIQPFLKEVLRECEEKKMERPKFSMITNGLRVADETLRDLKEHEFGITVSLDGMADVHDLLRPTQGGKPSHQRILETIEKMKALGLKVNLEATYTPAHLAKGIRIVDVLAYFQDLGIRRASISPVNFSGCNDELSDHAKTFAEQLPSLYAEASAYSLSSLLSERPIRLQLAFMVWRNVQRWDLRKIDQYCYADLGVDHLAVSTSGDVYPCQMLNGMTDHKMGNLFDESFSRAKALPMKVLSKASKALEPCVSCWAKQVCFQCPAGYALEHDGSPFTPDEGRCEMLYSIAREVLGFLANGMNDPEKREQIKRSMQAT